MAIGLADSAMKGEILLVKSRIGFMSAITDALEPDLWVDIGAASKKEAEERTVNIRRLGSQEQTSMSVESAIESLVLEATPPDIRRKLEAKKAKTA